jgi:aspartate oxidase
MNGGVAVDVWGRSSHPAIYAVGEAAGTHGVTRPGGAALNAGQVFGTRAAEHIAATLGAGVVADDLTGVAQVVGEILGLVGGGQGVELRAVRDAVQARMSDAAGILCDAATVRAALAEARALNAAIRARGIACGRASEAGRAVQWAQMALASEAVLTALDHYIAAGGGSRGARAILDPAGEGVPQSVRGPLEAVRFRAERAEDRGRQIVLRYRVGQFAVTERATRGMEGAERPFFERDWPAWLTGAIYHSGGGRA